MALRFLYLLFLRVGQLIRPSRLDSEDLVVEVLMLRREVAVLHRQVSRPALQPADRALLAGLARLLPRRRLRRFFVQPDTLLRWHRDLVRRHWTYPSRRPGRPSVPPGTVALVLRLAKENPTWSCRRIHGELATVGVTLAPEASGPSCAATTSSPPRGDRTHLGRVLPHSGQGPARLRLLQRRHRAARRLYLIYGINGSGKSTFASLLREADRYLVEFRSRDRRQRCRAIRRVNQASDPV